MFGFWQGVINWVFGKGMHKLSDFIGGCQVCFAHFIAWVGYIIWGVLWGHWLTLVLWIGVVPLIWYINLASKLLLDILSERLEQLKKQNEQ